MCNELTQQLHMGRGSWRCDQRLSSQWALCTEWICENFNEFNGILLLLMKSSLSPTLKISRLQRKLSSVILPNTRGILNCKILPNLPLEKQMFVSLLNYSLPPLTKKVSMWTCGVCPWVKTVRKSSVKLYFSFVLFSVHFKLHDRYRETGKHLIG